MKPSTTDIKTNLSEVSNGSTWRAFPVVLSSAGISYRY